LSRAGRSHSVVPTLTPATTTPQAPPVMPTPPDAERPIRARSPCRVTLLRIAEGTPEMTAAARSMAARTAVKERVKLLLYQPFARMLGVSQEYFEDIFPEEMGAKVADIPAENLITPPASVAVPALQGLSYTFEEPSLKEMYLNLLTTASDDRQADQAHPAFAEIIKQLTPNETKVLNAVLKNLGTPVARLKHHFSDPPGSYRVMLSHLIPLVEETTGEPKEEPQAPTWVDNWRRLGLVNVTYTEFQTDAGSYDWVQERPEYVRLADLITQLNFERGLIQTTDFGRQFLRAVTQ
jgi:Abortive infection alpha